MSRPTVKQMPGTTAGENEAGFTLITVMVVMVLLLGLALAAARSSLLEMLIARNNQEYAERFYQAESSAKEIAAKLDAISDRYELHPEDMDKAEGDWILSGNNQSGELKTLADVTAIWNAANPGDPAPFFDPLPADAKALRNILHDAADIKAMAIRRGAVRGDQGSSLNMGAGNPGGRPVIEYEIFGQARKKTATGGASAAAVIINVGYKQREP